MKLLIAARLRLRETVCTQDQYVRRPQPPRRGEVSYKSYRILVGKGLDGETVEIREQEAGWSILYADHPVRLLAPEHLKPNTVL